MSTVVLCLMCFGLGAYVSALAAGIGGTPLAQTMANVVGLSVLTAATAILSKWVKKG